MTMQIETIRINLERTIACKEKMLEEYRKARAAHGYGPGDLAKDAALFASISFLEMNLTELGNILADVIQAEKTYNRTISDLGWQINSDRQGGL